MPTQRKTLSTILLTILVLAFVFLVWQDLSLRSRLRVAEKTATGQAVNQKVLAFSQLFVSSVLAGGKAVSFDQRLELENAVRDIKDPKIYAAWQKFTGAKDQAATQQAFYSLFSLLLTKISN